MDKSPNFKLYNPIKEKWKHIEYTDNTKVAKANTLRLNSFMRDINILSENYEGEHNLYNYYDLANPNNSTQQKREGLEIDGKIMYFEDN